MKTHPVQMTRIDELPVSVFEDGSVEIVDETSGVPVTLSRPSVALMRRAAAALG